MCSLATECVLVSEKHGHSQDDQGPASLESEESGYRWYSQNTFCGKRTHSSHLQNLLERNRRSFDCLKVVVPPQRIRAHRRQGPRSLVGDYRKKNECLQKWLTTAHPREPTSGTPQSGRGLLISGGGKGNNHEIILKNKNHECIQKWLTTVIHAHRRQGPRRGP